MDKIGYLAGLLTLISYLPQTLKTIRTRKTKDLSLSTFIIIGTSAFLWTVYGIAKHVPAIWVTNSIVTVCSFIIAGIKIRNQEIEE